jgi:hypothetical protein
MGSPHARDPGTFWVYYVLKDILKAALNCKTVSLSQDKIYLFVKG